MGIDKVKKLLKHPHLHTVEVAIEVVNLTDNEREIIVLTELRGLTDQVAAEKMDCSIKTIYNNRKKALDKIARCWNKHDDIIKILEGV